MLSGFSQSGWWCLTNSLINNLKRSIFRLFCCFIMNEALCDSTSIGMQNYLEYCLHRDFDANGQAYPCSSYVVHNGLKTGSILICHWRKEPASFLVSCLAQCQTDTGRTPLTRALWCSWRGFLKLSLLSWFPINVKTTFRICKGQVLIAYQSMCLYSVTVLDNGLWHVLLFRESFNRDALLIEALFLKCNHLILCLWWFEWEWTMNLDAIFVCIRIPPVGETVWEGLWSVALLEEAYYWGRTLRFQNPVFSLFACAYGSGCELLATAVALCLPACSHAPRRDGHVLPLER